MDDFRDVYSDGSEPLGVIAPGGGIAGTIEAAYDRDVFKVELVAGRTYSVDLASVNNTLPGRSFTIYDASGGYLTSASSSNADPAHVSLTARITGSYYIAAQGNGDVLGTYGLSVSGGYVDDFRDTYNDAIEALGQIAPGGSRNGTVEEAYDRDVLKVELVAGRTYSVDLASVGDALTSRSFIVYDAAGGYLTSASSSNADAAHVSLTARVTGVYYIAAQGNGEVTGAYKVNVSGGYVDDFRDIYNDAIEALGDIATGSTRTGTVEEAYDRDVFKVDLVAGRTYSVDLASVGDALKSRSFTIYDAAGGYLTSASSSNADPASAVLTAATTGSYYISAQGNGEVTGAYAVSVSSGFVDDFRDSYKDASEALGSVAPGGAATGIIETVGDRDVFEIALAIGQKYSFKLQGTGDAGLATASLYLYDADGSYQMSATGNTADPAQFDFTAVEGGKYYLSAYGGYSYSLGGYEISVSGGARNDDYRNTKADTTLPLGSLPANGSRSGVIETGGDKDLFAVKLAAGKTYTFDLVGKGATGALGNPALTLTDSAGKTLFSNNDFNTLDSRIVYTATKSATFYLDAHGASTGPTGAYTISAKTGFDDFRDNKADTTAALGNLPVGGSLLGTLETAGDHDYIEVKLTKGANYTFDLIGKKGAANALADPYLILRDGTGKALQVNDDYNSDNSRIVFTATSSTTFYLDVKSATAAGVGGWELSARQNYDDYRDTRTDSSAGFGALPVDGSRYGWIEGKSDADWFSIKLAAGKSYTFDAIKSAIGGKGLADPELKLYTSGGTLILANDDFNGVDGRVVYTPTKAGTYYIEVKGGTGTGGYQLGAKFNFDDFADTKTDPASPLGKLVLDKPLLGVIETPGDDDYFAFTLEKGKTYEFDLHGGTKAGQLKDGDLHLLDKNGTILDYNDDIGATGDARIVFTAEATDTFYLSVGGIKSNIGLYEVVMSEFAVV